jgi:hypothetical protein
VISDVISFLALIMSGVAIWDTRRSNRAAQHLIDNELELARHQLSILRHSTASEQKANVSARMYKQGKNWKIRVFNTGPSDAKNVRLVLNEKNQFVTENTLRNKFPMTRMERGQSVDIGASVPLSYPPKENLTIRWDDSSGIDQENTVELTI